MLLFVAFELWGTGLQQAQAQDNLEGDLAERLRQVAAAGADLAPRSAARTVDSAPDAGAPEPIAHAGADLAAAAPEPPDGGEAPESEDPTPAAAGPEEDTSRTATADEGTSQESADVVAPDEPASVPEYPDLPQVVSHISEAATTRSVARLLDPEVEALLGLVYPAGGEAIGRIIIPAIGVDEIIVAGVAVEDLRKGPGHYSTTPLPGQPGNAALAGHRTTHGAPFGRIDELAPGDEIIVETLQGRFVYRVLLGGPGRAGQSFGYEIVTPTALEVLDDYGDNRLTLTSCHPKYSSKLRIIVHATLVGDPVVRLPRPGEPIGAEFAQLDVPEEPADETDAPDPGTEFAQLDAPEEPADETEAPAPGTGSPDDGVEPEPDDADRAPPQRQDLAGAPGGGSVDAAGVDSAEGNKAAAAPGRTAVPAGPVAEEGFGEGLSGDRGAIVPAVLWGLATAAVWMLGRAFGRQWRDLRAYTVAAVPFLVVLYVTFGYIDRALPAY